MFKDKLKKLRTEKGITQKELADKIFVSRSTIAKWENGNGYPSKTSLETLCTYFEVEEEWLIDKNYTITKVKKIQIVLIVVPLILIVVLSVIKSVMINKIDKSIVFFDDAVRIEEVIYGNGLPDGFHVTPDKITKIKNRFQYVNYMQHSFDLWAKGKQNVKFKIVSSDFINAGVEIYMFKNKIYGVQKLDLLYGKVWEDDTTDPVAIVDMDTARLVYGKINVVGETLRTNHGDLKIIGVVSNTMERQQSIDLAIERGEEFTPYHEHMYETNVYVPHGYYQTLGLVAYNNDVIICDDEMTTEEIINELKILLDIPSEIQYLFIDRQVILKHSIPSVFTLFTVIIYINVILLFIGIITITIQECKNNKKSIEN